MSYGTPPSDQSSGQDPGQQSGHDGADDVTVLRRLLPINDPYALEPVLGASPDARGGRARIALIVAVVVVVVASAIGGAVLLTGRAVSPGATPASLSGIGATTAIPSSTDVPAAEPTQAAPVVETTTTVTATASAPAPPTGWPAGPAVGVEAAGSLSTMPARTYRDERFGFSLPVPKDMRMSTSSDRTVWRWGTAALTVWGENTPKTLAAASADLAAVGADITYRQGSDASFVISGYLGDQIFYQKVLSGSTSSNWLYWEYPRADREALDVAVSRAALGFSPGDLTGSH